MLDGAVAIHAVNFDGVSGLPVELAIAVTVLLEVAVDAVHAEFKMDVFQVDGLFELVFVVG